MVGTRLTQATYAAVLCAMGCDGVTDPERLTLELLEGSWAATRYEYTSHADPTRKSDLLANGSFVTVDIGIDGRFVLSTAFPPGAPPATDPGSLRVGIRDVVMEFDVEPDDPLVFQYSFTVDTLLLRTDDVMFEFTAGQSESSSLVIELGRIGRPNN